MKKYLLLSLLQMLFRLSCSFCPYACQCNDQQLTAQCPQQAKLDVIPITLNPMIRVLSLKDNQIRDLDASLQFYIHLKQADFSHNLIESIPSHCFSSQGRLLKLDLSFNSIGNVTTDSFYGLQNLERLSLKGNRLENLTRDIFMHLDKLKSLDLSENLIARLDSLIFKNLQVLQSLDLSKNKFSLTTQEEIIDFPSSLAILDLSGNEGISKIAPRAFRTLDKLSILRLNDCNLRGIPKEVFSGVLARSLRELDLSNNSIAAVSGGLRYLTRLNVLKLGGNDIQVLKTNEFLGLKSITSLDISFSLGLHKIEPFAFATNSKLVNLILDGCTNLSSIRPEAFKMAEDKKNSSRLTKLRLQMHHMNWTRVPEELFLAVDFENEIEGLDLSPNPINCDCHALWLRNLLIQNPSLANASNIRCHSPKEYLGLDLNNLIEDQLICPDGHGFFFSNPVSRSGQRASAASFFQLMLVSLCVSFALFTGITVLVLVHCSRNRWSLSNLCLWNKSSRCSTVNGLIPNDKRVEDNSPSYQQCICCTISSNGKSLLKRPGRRQTTDEVNKLYKSTQMVTSGSSCDDIYFLSNPPSDHFLFHATIGAPSNRQFSDFSLSKNMKSSSFSSTGCEI